jgi:hypothetical protein
MIVTGIIFVCFKTSFVIRSTTSYNTLLLEVSLADQSISMLSKIKKTARNHYERPSN